uniref:Ubiquitin-like protease family profile domain-containing protein n=1 Tax=Chenopodium quinoa TaxID=63459 RepID=A0A803MFI0_CHEQI
MAVYLPSGLEEDQFHLRWAEEEGFQPQGFHPQGFQPQGFHPQGQLVKQKDLVVVTQKTYCSGKALSLDKDRRAIIERCGFGDLFNIKMKKTMLNRGFAYWLMSRVDGEKGIFEMGDGRLVPLCTAQWRYIFGIPAGRKNLPRRVTDGGLALKDYFFYFFFAIKEMYGVKDKNGEWSNVSGFLALRVCVGVVAREYDWCSLAHQWVMSCARDFASKFEASGYAARAGGCSLFLMTGDKIKEGYEKDLKKTKDYGLLKVLKHMTPEWFEEKLTPWLHRLEQLYSSGCRVVVRAPLERKTAYPVLSVSSKESEEKQNDGHNDEASTLDKRLGKLDDKANPEANLESGVDHTGEQTAGSLGPRVEEQPQTKIFIDPHAITYADLNQEVGEIDFSAVFGGNGTGEVGGFEDDVSTSKGGVVVQDAGDVPTKGGSSVDEGGSTNPNLCPFLDTVNGKVRMEFCHGVVCSSKRAEAHYVRAAAKMYTKEWSVQFTGHSQRVMLDPLVAVVFVPVLIEEHWWCAAFHLKDEKIWLIDSIHPEPSFIHDDALDELA